MSASATQDATVNLHGVGLIQESDLAFPSGTDVYDHAPSAQFRLDPEELLQSLGPRDLYTLGEEATETKIEAFQQRTGMQSRHIRAEESPLPRAFGVGFGGSDPYSFILCDAATRAFLRAHPLFRKPVFVEPLASTMIFKLADSPGHGKGLFAVERIPKN